MKASLVASFSAVFTLFFALPAGAHSLLTNPPPITPDDNAKSGPCGCYFGGGPEDPGDDGSPSPCPGDFQITTLQAGTQLKVEWLETINHDGSFRIAFSPKPPDQVTKADMDAGVVIDMPDNNPTSGAALSQMIDLPAEPCDLCTIQLRQFMMGAAQPYYYTCAAVKIVGGGSTSSGGTTTTTTSSMGMGGAGGATGSGAASGEGGDGGSMGAGMADPQPKIAQGCSIEGEGNGALESGAALAIVGLSLAARTLRRRAVRRRAGRGRASQQR